MGASESTRQEQPGAGDAQIVEAQFQAGLATIGDGVAAEGASSTNPDQGALSAEKLAAQTSQKTSTVATQRSRGGTARPLGKTVRLRDKEHWKIRDPAAVPSVRQSAVGFASSHVYTTACIWT